MAGVMTKDAGGTQLLSPSLIFILGSGSPHHVLSIEETETATESLESPEGTQNRGFPARGRVAGS